MADLRGALVPPTTKHRTAITRPKRLGELMAAIYGWTKDQETTVAGLKLIALLALRPGKLRAAAWEEIDLEAGVWTVPARRTKMRRPHRMPLPLQAVAILQKLLGATRSGISTFVFPATVSVRKPMSKNTLTFALRRLDIGADDMTAHGFRTAFATLANESRRWHPDAIER
ncbi:integrase [Ancylobacter sp. 3268]|nr:tyrosine-type recombinase/integrase [Ancylobacter sp. 3268]MDR6953854.1 integrase [Ancylobacter sp. 3268]